ncbi:ADP-ribosyl cyclase/cyclic ADP-ribose hydrolase 1-like [Conger conger]|uniref:ADP-ribosyl cyclase/cyclic ADP-ribose hydrolase 1-like n=1 Tax=Conger conger TaxID=82655 RepID=UPI002A5A712D|nr:ADP-ribosyl cyclase/cyclic ADP-ribose hydrolase 1-like [Conger conger]
MDYQAPSSQRRRCRRPLLLGACVLILLIVVCVCLGVAFGRRAAGPSNDRITGNFTTAIISKCKQFLGDENSSENKCEEVWDAFSKAYVGKDPCEVPMEAYDPLMQTVREKDACNRMLFWSKTKDIVHQFTEAKKCLLTLEDTLLGFVMDGQTWCSEKGSKETFTTGCPSWDKCERNPVRSFWNRASEAFAQAACGEVTAMLNGSISTPFNNNSIFASIEVKKFSGPKMRALNVVLVKTGNDTATCENDSLQTLQRVLNPSLKYTCKEVQRSKILDCISDPDRPCGDCW